MQTEPIHHNSIVTDLVIRDHRATGIFRKYNINFCCGGNITLDEACKRANADLQEVLKELTGTLRVSRMAVSVDSSKWTIDFLIDYLVNVHHTYLYDNLPDLRETMVKFTSGHQSKYSYLGELMGSFHSFSEEIFPHLEHEEKVIFPYIRQIAHGHEDREPYAALLVRTLRKPIDTLILHEQQNIEQYLTKFRDLTNDYTPPASACVTHKVALSKLKELDTDLSQHVYLENELLFPKALQIEKELKAFYK